MVNNNITWTTPLIFAVADTEAMAGIALLCVKRFNNYPRELVLHIKKSVKSIKDKIVASQNPKGELGNIYSTPLAVQVSLQIH